MASKTIKRDNSTFYTIYMTASITSETATTATVTWKSYVTFGQWYQWGLNLTTKMDSTQLATVDGACTTSGQTICSKTGTRTINKGTSVSTVTFSATTASKEVNGYGGIGSSYVGTATATVTIPAQSAYTVSYDANGGTGAPSAQTKTAGTALTLSSTEPTMDGYVFMGWGTTETDASVNYAAGASYTTDASTTLYAIWGRTVTVTYDANGGTDAPSAQSATVIDNATSNLKTFTLSTANPSKDGYRFAGWTPVASNTYASYLGGNKLTTSTSVTLYAVWHTTAYDNCDLCFQIGDNALIQDINYRID